MTLSAAQMLSVIAAGPQDSHSREEAKGPRTLQRCGQSDSHTAQLVWYTTNTRHPGSSPTLR
jgi:hypothetical protein